jgi:hypothetical protein
MYPDQCVAVASLVQQRLIELERCPAIALRDDTGARG